MKKHLIFCLKPLSAAIILQLAAGQGLIAETQSASEAIVAGMSEAETKKAIFQTVKTFSRKLDESVGDFKKIGSLAIAFGSTMEDLAVDEETWPGVNEFISKLVETFSEISKGSEIDEKTKGAIDQIQSYSAQGQEHFGSKMPEAKKAENSSGEGTKPAEKEKAAENPKDLAKKTEKPADPVVEKPEEPVKKVAPEAKKPLEKVKETEPAPEEPSEKTKTPESGPLKPEEKPLAPVAENKKPVPAKLLTEPMIDKIHVKIDEVFKGLPVPTKKEGQSYEEFNQNIADYSAQLKENLKQGTVEL